MALGQGVVSPERELERARAALAWERMRTLRDARLRANIRLALYAATLAAAWNVPAHWITWLAAQVR